MRAIKDQAVIYISEDQIKSYVNAGYKITEDDGTPIDDPMLYATDKPNTVTIPWSALSKKG